MQKFNYSFTAKFFYRYINIVITIFLLLFTFVSILVSFQKWYFIFLVLFNVLIIYLLNKSYLFTYKNFPTIFFVEDEKIICSGFFLSKKKVEINFKDIITIEGGIFSGMPMRAVYIKDNKNNIIGFYSHVGKFNELLKIILRNVPDEVYKNQLEMIKKISLK